MDKPESRHEYGPESLSPDPQEPESSGPSPSWARVPDCPHGGPAQIQAGPRHNCYKITYDFCQALSHQNRAINPPSRNDEQRHN